MASLPGTAWRQGSTGHPSHVLSITGLWVPIHKLPGRPQQTGRGQHSSGAPHSPQAPSQGSRGRSSPLWAPPCGDFSCSPSHLSRQTSPFIYPAARSSHFPRKALFLLPSVSAVQGTQTKTWRCHSNFHPKPALDDRLAQMTRRTIRATLQTPLFWKGNTERTGV